MRSNHHYFRRCLCRQHENHAASDLSDGLASTSIRQPLADDAWNVTSLGPISWRSEPARPNSTRYPFACCWAGRRHPLRAAFVLGSFAHHTTVPSAIYDGTVKRQLSAQAVSSCRLAMIVFTRSHWMTHDATLLAALHSCSRRCGKPIGLHLLRDPRATRHAQRSQFPRRLFRRLRQRQCPGHFVSRRQGA